MAAREHNGRPPRARRPGATPQPEVPQAQRRAVRRARPRDGEAADALLDIQRRRMIAALVEVAGERGVSGATVAHIVSRSGVSRRTFYELFDDREDCLLAAFDLAVECAARRVLPAFQGPGGWAERTRTALAELLAFLEEQPGMGRLLLVDVLGAGPVALERRARIVAALVDAVHEGRRTKAGSVATRVTAEGVVGAVLGVLHTRLAGGQARATADLLGPLMAIVVLPYQGRARAAREASRPAPPRRAAQPPQDDPLRDLDMRLTYRTVRTLQAIAERPGANNRQVAEAAGVADQGQISKLLARLGHLGLIENRAGFERGDPNAWALTARGEDITRALRAQALPGALASRAAIGSSAASC